mgnify:CR=1 FL=1
MLVLWWKEFLTTIKESMDRVTGDLKAVESAVGQFNGHTVTFISLYTPGVAVSIELLFPSWVAFLIPFSIFIFLSLYPSSSFAYSSAVLLYIRQVLSNFIKELVLKIKQDYLDIR